jgi:hypothetical protein
MEHIITNKFLWSLRSGIRYGLLALLTFSGAHYFTLYVLGTYHYAPIGALWALITGTVVSPIQNEVPLKKPGSSYWVEFSGPWQVLFTSPFFRSVLWGWLS